ncbi:hypothetical protein FACS189449_12200 [Alphaproteobacteria bacterium]|nr:hypothetical protein FACS189449_12200 [Alphaproteobacteria bacterium]
MRFFENHGAVKVIDSAKGALLLQRAIPGNSLTEYFSDREDESIRIAANVIQKVIASQALMASPPAGMYASIVFNAEADSVEVNATDAITYYIQKAKRVAEHLQKTTAERVVMHGDLHHDNIVQDGNEWKIIDPTGVIGDPVYEIASFMINPIDKIWKHENALSIVKNRIDAFSKLLNVDPIRIAQWTFVKSVLCWIWTLETPNQDRSELAKLFDKVVGDKT